APQVEAARKEIEGRRDAVEKALAGARKAAATGRFEEALRLLDADSAIPQVATIRKEIEARRDGIEKAVTEATQLAAAGRFDEALKLLDAHAAADAGQPPIAG